MGRTKGISTKAARDMFVEQTKWSVWFIGIMMIVHVVFSIISWRFNFAIGDLFAFSSGSTSVYMLVIGIIAGSAFLAFYVKQGVTRRDYYCGAVLAAFGLAFALALTFYVFSYIEWGIFAVLNLPITLEPMTLDFGINHWLVLILLYTINSFIYYLIGWAINLGFYRYNVLVGLVFCVLATVFVAFYGLFMVDGMAARAKVEALNQWYYDVPLPASVLVSLVLIGILLYVIRLLTKKIPVKV
jgi:hypothetical protein